MSMLNKESFIAEEQAYNYTYHNLIKYIMTYGYEMLNQRTNTKITAVANQAIGYNIVNKIPLINTRKMFPVTAFAELCWTLSGDKKLDWLQQHTKMWDNFANENNEVEAAYGYRWRHMFGRDQLLQGLEALKNDPTDRQIYISAWDNSKDGLGNHWTSNVPCPTSFAMNIIGNKLNLTLFLRSSDVIVGLPYDLMMYSLLLVVCTHELQAAGLDITYGDITAMLSHAHIYEPHYIIAGELYRSAFVWGEKDDSTSLRTASPYIIQDLDLTQNRILWKLQTVSNIIQDRDTAMLMFKDCMYEQFGKNPKYPKMYKPEVIK